MSLVHQAFMTTEFTLVVDSSNWKSGKFIIIAVQTSYSLTDDSVLESETSFCDICHKNCTSQQILLYIKSVFILCLPLFVCPICHFTYITPFLLTYAHYWISWWSRNSNLFHLGFRNCSGHAILQFSWCDSSLISSTCLIIMQDNNLMVSNLCIFYVYSDRGYVCLYEWTVVLLRLESYLVCVDKFQCRSGILSGFNLNSVFLPKLW